MSCSFVTCCNFVTCPEGAHGFVLVPCVSQGVRRRRLGGYLGYIAELYWILIGKDERVRKVFQSNDWHKSPIWLCFVFD
jgi:hypothetical protein